MPNRALLLKEESVAPEYTPYINQFTLLLSGKFVGDLKLETLFVYQGENPTALNGKDEELLAMPTNEESFGTQIKNAWLTVLIFKV
ncbi:hypothetical protein CEXT_76681 [Caerostris extrusa]|uniref:Uncharacterized protein n=1 Tax=Caerostris extrusa TaxID=172846 RepID=A0AAV4TED4_CAEEX|nr:hypothetical protein CEXT_76681 [Caerostris extrusa]